MYPAVQGPLRVTSIVGHRQVEMAVLCLGSLLRHSAEELALRLHDDGSLTMEDRERLAGALRDPEVVSRAEADERTGDFLARHPALRAFRRGNVMALKLIDAMLFAGDELAYCDSDILFLRPFSGLYPLGETLAGAMFMSDRQNAYSIRSWHLLRYPGLRLPRRLNAGLTAFRAAGFDLDLLEWYVSRPKFQFSPVWMEQTAWGLLAGRVGCRLWDPRRIRLPEPGEVEAPEEVVALHFVSPLRDLLPRILEWAPDRTGETPVALETVPARRCRSWDLAWTELRRRAARI
ncbi:MAG: hypothetical protein QOF89_3407 [Acidobacteriota bacterium]|jgi:hypothetical protein|nr:hypothetical protein [Acidobacteriota bacterium]